MESLLIKLSSTERASLQEFDILTALKKNYYDVSGLICPLGPMLVHFMFMHLTFR